MKRVFLALACVIMLASCSDVSEDKNAKTNDNQSVMIPEEGFVSDSLDVDGYVARARWYLANEQVGNAIRDINSALSIDGKNVDALLVLADIYYALGDQDNILLTLNKASEIAPMDSRPIVKLAELSFLQGNVNMANAYIDKALELNSINPQAYYMRGIIYMSKNDTVQALKQFMKSRACTTAESAVTSRTCPRRVPPSGDVISTSSSNATSEMFSMKTSGPSMDDTPLYSKPFIINNLQFTINNLQ